jgi:hypothetical protein
LVSPKLHEPRVEQARTDFFPAILERRKPIAVIEPPVAALAATRIEHDGNPAPAAEPLDFTLEFVAVHSKNIAQICANFKVAIG